MNYYLETLKKYAVFGGRASRKEFFIFVLTNDFILLLLYTWLGIENILPLLFGLALALPTLGVLVRRLHDTNHSGWWIFISLIPIIGAIWIIVLLLTDGQPGENQYGLNPKNTKSS